MNVHRSHKYSKQPVKTSFLHAENGTENFKPHVPISTDFFLPAPLQTEMSDLHLLLNSSPNWKWPIFTQACGWNISDTQKSSGLFPTKKLGIFQEIQTLIPVWSCHYAICSCGDRYAYIGTYKDFLAHRIQNHTTDFHESYLLTITSLVIIWSLYPTVLVHSSTHLTWGK